MRHIQDASAHINAHSVYSDVSEVTLTNSYKVKMSTMGIVRLNTPGDKLTYMGHNCQLFFIQTLES